MIGARGFTLGERVVVRPQSPGVRQAIGDACHGTIEVLWDDGAAYVKLDESGEMLACGVSAMTKERTANPANPVTVRYDPSIIRRERAA